MRVAAPGKLMLTGSYAVLEGAPALVCAVSRLAVAGGDPTGTPMAEVLAAMDGAEAPGVDVSDLFSGEQKLGLGSSAAAVVAALGHRAAVRGEDLNDARVRRAIFEAAREAHARVQNGGSGVDVAASVYGGVLRYRLSPDGPTIGAVTLPKGVGLDTYWSGQSVRTSDMRARVDALKVRDMSLFEARMGDLEAAAEAAASAVEHGRAGDLVDAVRRAERGLAALGRDADAPIVPPFVRDLAQMAEDEGCAFLPSGAGGGDVFVRLGSTRPSPRFGVAAREAGLERLELDVDVLGVRVISKLGVR